MEFFKDFFNDDKKVVGLCAFKKQQEKPYCFKFEPKIKSTKFLYETNTTRNFLIR